MERIGKYVTHKMAVTTGYAQVFFCHDPDLMVPVAIKVFDPRRLEGGPLSPAQMLARFVTEARTLATLDHPCIVGIKALDHLDEFDTLNQRLLDQLRQFHQVSDGLTTPPEPPAPPPG